MPTETRVERAGGHRSPPNTQAEPLTFRPLSWVGKDTCKDPIPVDSPRANQVALSQLPAVPLALCFLKKGMQDPLQVHICSEGQHSTLSPRSPPGPHKAQPCGVASEPTNPWLPTTPPSGAPQSAMNRSHSPHWGLQN